MLKYTRPSLQIQIKQSFIIKAKLVKLQLALNTPSFPSFTSI